MPVQKTAPAAIKTTLLPTRYLDKVEVTALVDIPQKGIETGDMLTLRLEQMRLNAGVQAYSIGLQAYMATFTCADDLLAVWKIAPPLAERVRGLFNTPKPTP